MKYPTKLSDAIHILAFIALNSNEDLTSDSIALSIHTHPSYVRQLMSALKKENLLITTQGRAKPALARAAQEITLFDIYKAIEGDKPLLHQDTHTNPECGVGINIQLTIRDVYDIVQEEAQKAMQKISLQEILDRYKQKLINLK